MEQCRKVFEAMMRSKGHDNFSKTKTGKYAVPNLQTRWAYFMLGWEMARATEKS